MSGAAPLPPHPAIPPDIASLADYERHAPRHMSAESWRHLQDGWEEGLGPHGTRAAFDRLRLVPRMLADLRGGSTRISLFGRDHAAPVLLAPIAYQRIAHAEGELAAVRAAMALDTGMVVSTLSSVPLEEIAEAGRQAARELGKSAPAALWFQLYLQEDRAASEELLQRAEAAGYEAIVVTVDASIKRSGFVLPPGVDAANLRGMARRIQTTTPTGGILFGTPLADAAPRWEDIAWLRSATSLPLIVKGILSPEDAVLAVERGVDGLIVSNHGGRVLEGLASPVEVLPGIVKAVGGQVPLLLDSGVRSGADIVRSLALGADAVLLGRPYMHALAVAGMIGVAHALHLLRAELELAMAQIGCASLAEIGADRIFFQ